MRLASVRNKVSVQVWNKVRDQVVYNQVYDQFKERLEK